MLIEAFSQLHANDWKLVFVGGASDTPGYTESLRALAAGNPNIFFSGELHGKLLAEAVRGAGLFVLPSDVEGCSLALLEAMREGVPVLTSDIPVHRQILGDGRGLWFTCGDVQSCSVAMGWAMQNPDAMKARADSARRYVESTHTWDSIVASWLALYRQKLGISAPAKAPVIL